jgi:uncharacterized protein YrrD
MLLLSKSLMNQPVMSLRTGRQVATAYQIIFNPSNLKIEGFYCQDSIDKKQQLVLLAQDIRDIIPTGIVVNDHGVLAEPADLIRLKPIMDIGFELLGKLVVTVTKKKLGKVNDFACDPQTLYVQKLYVSQSVLKSLTGGSLSIDRTQIVETTNRKITVQDPLQPKLANAPAVSTAPAT